MSAKFKQVIYAGQKLVDESGGGSNYQEKSVTPSETAQTVQADSGYDALSKVYVDAISSDYVGSGVARKSSSDIALSGATLTAPAGYYENDATKSLSEQAAATITPTNTDQTAVAANKYTTGAVTVEGVVCSNLTAENIVSGVTVKVGTATDDDSVASVTGTASGGGGDSKENEIINRTISGTYTNNGISTIGNYAFAQCGDLISANFSNATVVGGGAFYYCSKLKTISLPEVVSVYGAYTFQSCLALKNLSLPKATYLGQSLFSGCYIEHISLPVASSFSTDTFNNAISLQDIYLPSATTIVQGMFQRCTSLVSVDIPLATTIGGSAFANCSKLTEVSFSLVTSIGNSAFMNCYSLETINMPALETISTAAFRNCSSLTTFSHSAVKTLGYQAFIDCKWLNCVSLDNATLINQETFKNCNRLLSLYLLGSSVCVLSAYTAFTSTPISTYTTQTGGVNGSIFVRASLYDTYKSAANWVTYSDRFVSLTDAQIAAL